MTSTPSAREFLFDGLKRILGDDGLAIGDGLSPSDQQRDYAQRWCETICRGIESHQSDRLAPASIMMASADTGTGKTLGYGVPLLLRASMGVKVGIATYSHALQTQFLGTPDKKGDLIRIADWLAQLGLGNLVIRRRVGRQAFISLSAVESLIARLRQHRAEEGLTVADLQELEPLVEFAMNANAGSPYSSGLIEDLVEELGGELPLGILPSSICLGLDSSPEDNFRYDEHLEQAEKADVVIFSHSYLSSCAQFRRGRLLDAPIDTLVVDEADRLADVAASSLRHDLSLRRCAKSITNIAGVEGKHAAELLDRVGELAHLAHRRHGEKAIALAEMTNDTKRTLAQNAAMALIALQAVIAKLKKRRNVSAEDLAELGDSEIALARFVRAADGTQSGDYGGGFLGAVSFSPIHSLPSISVLPVDQGAVMARLWDTDQEGGEDTRHTFSSVLLTSATLGVPGHFAEARERFQNIAYELGVRMQGLSKTGQFAQKPELDLWGSFEPEKFGGVRFILADPALPSPTLGPDEDNVAELNGEWLQYAASMVREASKSGGRTLVLCNSYKDVMLLAEALTQNGAANVIEQLRGRSSVDCQNRFLENEQAIWLSPTSWEGVNLPGAIQNLVVLRLPFGTIDATTRALLHAKGKYSDTAAKNILYARMMNATKRKLRQGIGRPIRSKSDKARIWIADARFPLSPSSQLPLRHPGVLQYSRMSRFEALHAVVPQRFQRALENASVMLRNGEVIG